MTSKIEKVFTIFLLAGLSYAVGLSMEYIGFLVGLTTYGFLFWVSISEETSKWLIYRDFKFKYALYFVWTLAFLESVVRGILAEVHWSGLILGSAFWYVVVMRFIVNGHLFFFLIAYAASRIAYQNYKGVMVTGRTINLVGVALAIALHTYWNYFSIFQMDFAFYVLLFGLALFAVFVLMQKMGDDWFVQLRVPQGPNAKPVEVEVGRKGATARTRNTKGRSPKV